MVSLHVCHIPFFQFKMFVFKSSFDMFLRFLFLFFLNACIPLYDVHLSTYISTCTLEKGNMCTLHHYYLLFSKIKIIMYILYCFLTVFFHIIIHVVVSSHHDDSDTPHDHNGIPVSLLSHLQLTKDG